MGYGGPAMAMSRDVLCLLTAKGEVIAIPAFRSLAAMKFPS